MVYIRWADQFVHARSVILLQSCFHPTNEHSPLDVSLSLPFVLLRSLIIETLSQ